MSNKLPHNKIIFLDIDGVINVAPYDKFCKERMGLLRHIIEQTGAKIVISSSWRSGSKELTWENLKNHGDMDDWFKDQIIGETIRKYHQTKEGSHISIVRGNEIKTWVDRNLVYPWHENEELKEAYKINRPEDGSFLKMDSNKVGVDFTYVILDDDNDMLMEQARWFIHTHHHNGLTKEDAQKAIELLNKI